MIQRLVQNLSENINVPDTLKIITHLKRMFSNQIELEILFLQQRLKYFDLICQQQLNMKNSYSYVRYWKKYLFLMIS